MSQGSKRGLPDLASVPLWPPVGVQSLANKCCLHWPFLKKKVMGLDRLDLALSAFKLWEKIDDPVGFKIGYISLSSYLFYIITQRKMMQKKIKDNSS